MSLQIWLPLTGDLYNQGLGKYQIIGNNLEVVNDGQIGKCYSFNGSSSRIYIPNVSLGNIWSYGCWVKTPTSDSRGWELVVILNNNGSDADSQLAFWIQQKENRIESLANTKYDSHIDYTNYYSTWHHFFATYNGTILTTYIDATIVKTQTITDAHYNATNLTIGAKCANIAGTSFTNYFEGQLNDFRLYDHCLSTKEVKKIAQGLVLHYKLDSIFNNKIYDISGYKNNASVIGTAIFESSTPRYTQAIHMTNTSTANHIECENLLIPSNTMSISFWVKTAKATNQVLFVYHNLIEFALLNSLGYVNPAASSAGFTLTDFINNAWNHIVVIRDGTNFYLYVNGKSATRNGANNYYTHNNTKLYLLNRSYNNNYAANASLSDFRVYTTILTQDQVKELYNTSMIVSGSTIKPRDLE